MLLILYPLVNAIPTVCQYCYRICVCLARSWKSIPSQHWTKVKYRRYQSNGVTISNSNNFVLLFAFHHTRFRVRLAYVKFRNASQDERLSIITRMNLLELIELRAKNWHVSDGLNTYYKHKVSDVQVNIAAPKRIFGLLGKKPIVLIYHFVCVHFSPSRTSWQHRLCCQTQRQC